MTCRQFKCWRKGWSQCGRAVDLLPQDVGVTGVPRGFLDHVHHDPPQRTPYRPSWPGSGAASKRGQLGAGAYDLIASGTGLPARSDAG